MSCFACSKEFNKCMRKPLTCLRCTTAICKSCLTKDIPKCLQCDYEFDDDFIATHFSKRFIVNDLKVYRMNALFRKEEQMLPETKHYTSYELKMREVRERMKTEHAQFKLLEQKHKANMHFYKGLLNEWDMALKVDKPSMALKEEKPSMALQEEKPSMALSDINNIPDIPGATDTLLKYHKLLQDIQETELIAIKPVSDFMENIDIRMKYSLGEYSKDEFIKLLYNNNKNKNKSNDRYNIFNSFFIEGVLLFDELLECGSMECIASIIVAFEDLLSKKNTALQNAAKKYSCKMPSIAI